MSPDGTAANRRGKQLEKQVTAELDAIGYVQIIPPTYLFAMREMSQPVYAQQVEVGRDIYGKVRRVDVLLFHPHKHPNGLIVQCKWQSSGGSVDEKYPFEVLSIQRGEYDALIVLDGGGYSAGAEQWLRSQAGNNRLKHVFNLGEFLRYASRGNI